MHRAFPIYVISNCRRRRWREVLDGIIHSLSLSRRTARKMAGCHRRRSSSFVFLYVYIYMYACIYSKRTSRKMTGSHVLSSRSSIFTYIYMYVYMCVYCVYVCVLYTCICMYVYVYICMCTYVSCLYVHMYVVCIYIHIIIIYICTYICTLGTPRGRWREVIGWGQTAPGGDGQVQARGPCRKTGLQLYIFVCIDRFTAEDRLQL